MDEDPKSPGVLVELLPASVIFGAGVENMLLLAVVGVLTALTAVEVVDVEVLNPNIGLLDGDETGVEPNLKVDVVVVPAG